MNDPIIDLIIRIKNGYLARLEELTVPQSKFKAAVLKKLKSLGYIKDYGFADEEKRTVRVELLYRDGVPAVTDVKIVSKPGRRWYSSVKDLKPVLSATGFSIVSTSKGVVTNIEAKRLNLGGELLFQIW